MADDQLYRVEITRTYSRGHERFAPGSVIDVPEHVADDMEAATPPYGKRRGKTPKAVVAAAAEAGADVVVQHLVEPEPGPDYRATDGTVVVPPPEQPDKSAAGAGKSTGKT